MSRRRSLARRNPCGRLARNANEIMPPTEVRRLRDAAASGLRDTMWSSEVGRLYLTSKLSSVQFAAARRWFELTAAYSVACGSPRAPASPALEVGIRSTAPDVDTLAGRRQLKAHEAATLAFLSGKDVLRLAGPLVERVVDQTVIHDLSLAGQTELDALCQGLQALSATWTSRRKPARV